MDARAALAMVKDSSEVLSKLLSGGHSIIAGRLAGAFRSIGRERTANEILAGMKSADYKVREENPFKDNPSKESVKRKFFHWIFLLRKLSPCP